MAQQVSDDSWQARAACRGPQAAAFFPPPQLERKEARVLREHKAKAICAGCPVSTPCLEYAISINESHGIWGGLNEFERKRVVDSRSN